MVSNTSHYAKPHDDVFLLVDSDADLAGATSLAHNLALPLQVSSPHQDQQTGTPKAPTSASDKDALICTEKTPHSKTSRSKKTLKDPRLHLHLTKEGLQLEQADMTLMCDFKALMTRIKPGKLNSELLVKASKLKSKKGTEHEGDLAPRPLAIDATAGLGSDSFLLAAAGFSVHMFEQDPLIAALLQDGLKRAQKDSKLFPIVSHMHLHKQDSIAALKQAGNRFAQTENGPKQKVSTAFAPDATEPLDSRSSLTESSTSLLPGKPDVIYLDPMFPARTKSAAVKKKFQLIHLLEHPCENEEELLEAAIAFKPHKVVVKRMLKGPYLANKKPSYSLKGKSIRYDCYVFA